MSLQQWLGTLSLCASTLLYPVLAECRDRPGDIDLYNSDLVSPLFKRDNPTLPTWFHRGSAPTEAGLQRLKTLGIGTIIDLRAGEREGQSIQQRVIAHCQLATPHLPLAPAQEQVIATKLGLDYKRLPMTKTPDAQQIVSFFTWLKDAHLKKPIYLHCQHGRDRTGVMISLYHFQQDHWNLEQALHEMRGYGFLPALEPEIMTFLKAQKS